MAELSEHYSHNAEPGALRLTISGPCFSFSTVATTVIISLLFCARTNGSLLPFDGLLNTAVSNSIDPTQDNFIIGPPSFPFMASHTAVLGSSSSTGNYAFQLGANYVDYLITMQHNCVQQIDNHTSCRTSGFVEFTPRTDVFVTIDGAYHYNMTTAPMRSSAGATVLRVGSPTTVVFGDGDTRNALFSPASGTISLSASGILAAGYQYRLSYSGGISFLGGGANVTATANGQVHFRVTEVPEPAALGLLAFGSLLVLRPRRRSRSC